MARRSVLFTPGDRPDMLRKAPDVGADALVFDLEDAVAPGRIDEARDAVRDVLSGTNGGRDYEQYLRVNPLGAGGETDASSVIADLSPGDLDAILLPKVSTPADVSAFADLLSEYDRPLPILALIESATGILNTPEIAAVDATDALVFGAEDLAADLGATRTEDGMEVLYARQRVVVAARAAGVDAIDTVFTDVEDADGLADEAKMAAEFGYDGKMAIHPRQVGVINDAFTPADERIAWARRILDARDEAAADERAVFSVDGEMVDAPVIAQAERVVERARAAGIM